MEMHDDALGGGHAAGSHARRRKLNEGVATGWRRCARLSTFRHHKRLVYVRA